MVEFIDSFSFDNEFFEELRRFSEGVDYCEYAVRLNTEIYSSDGSTYRNGTILCKKRCKAASQSDYTCGLKGLGYNKEGELEAQCAFFGEKILFKLNDLEKKENLS